MTFRQFLEMVGNRGEFLGMATNHFYRDYQWLGDKITLADKKINIAYMSDSAKIKEADGGDGYNYVVYKSHTGSIDDSGRAKFVYIYVRYPQGAPILDYKLVTGPVRMFRQGARASEIMNAIRQVVETTPLAPVAKLAQDQHTSAPSAIPLN